VESVEADAAELVSAAHNLSGTDVSKPRSAKSVSANAVFFLQFEKCGLLLMLMTDNEERDEKSQGVTTTGITTKREGVGGTSDLF
jgi:hypothetical protein